MYKLKIQLTFILCIILSVSFLSAQETKKTLTLHDAVIGQRSYLYPKYVHNLQWLPNNKYTYTYTEENILYKQSTKKKESSKVLTLEDITKSHSDLAEVKRFPRHKWISDKAFSFYTVKGQFKYNLETGKSEIVFPYVQNAVNQDISPDKIYTAFTIDNNLLITDGKQSYAITDESNAEVVYGQAVHRYEFGIHKGTFWSPQSHYLAFYRKDESMVSNYPLVDITKMPAAVTSIKYPMAGQKSHHVTLGVYSLETKETVYINTGEPKEQYLTNVAWSPDEKYIFIAVLNRAQNHIKLNQYDVKTGELVKTIFEEKHDKYLSILHPMMFLPNKDNEFLWRSERDGFEHIYHYNLDGKIIKQLTKGEWVVTDIIGFSDKNKKLIIKGTDNNGLDTQIYAVDIAKGSYTKVSPLSGSYGKVLINENSNLLIATSTSLETPYQADIISTKGKHVHHILKAENPLAEYKVSKTELFQIKAQDKTPLNCRMIKPADFKPEQKYPVIVYVYNGPGVQLIKNRWQGAAPLWMQHAAQRGYIVFTVDGRGSENRGRDFEQITHLRLGDIEIQDQLEGVKYLKSLPYVDSERMAVHGWSYGGFMTTSLMLKQPDVFKVGVAGGAVMDWNLYEIMYTERYMSTPEKNPAGYKKAVLFDKVQNLKGDLLIIHDTFDDVVVPQHAYKFLDASIKNGVQVDFFAYPMHKHNVLGKDRVHLIEKVLDYIDEKLNK